MFSLFKLFFSCGGEKKTYLKRRPLFRSQIFKFCCDIQGSHLIGYLWVSLIIDQSECLICFFLCTELTLFCTELPENCIYLNQSELSNFSMYNINNKTAWHFTKLVLWIMDTWLVQKARAIFSTNTIQKPNTTWSPAFSRALGSSPVFTLNSNWLLLKLSFRLIGCCDNFGYGFMTLDRKAL